MQRCPYLWCSGNALASAALHRIAWTVRVPDPVSQQHMLIWTISFVFGRSLVPRWQSSLTIYPACSQKSDALSYVRFEPSHSDGDRLALSLVRMEAHGLLPHGLGVREERSVN